MHDRGGVGSGYNGFNERTTRSQLSNYKCCNCLQDEVNLAPLRSLVECCERERKRRVALLGRVGDTGNERGHIDPVRD